MARGQKKEKKELTPEERLQQALVPKKERPYELPEEWKWVRIGDLNHFESVSVNPSNTPDRTFELYSVPSCDQNYPEIIKGADVGSTKQIVEQGDVLLCKINPRINRVWYVAKHTDSDLIASSEWIVIRNRNIEPRYLMYCLKSQYFRQLMLSNVSGVGGSLMRAQPKYVKTYLIPIAPHEIQVKIANFLDHEFARLNEAKDQIQSVLDSLEERKQSILYKAFTGELTERWRNDNLFLYKKSSYYSNVKKAIDGIEKKKIKKAFNPFKDELKRTIPKEWILKDLESISRQITDGEHTTPSRVNEYCGYYLLSARNVRDDYILLDNVDYIDEDEYKRISERCNPKRGNVLISCSGSVGRVCVINDDNRYCMVRSVAMVSTVECNSRFVMYMLQSPAVQQEIKELSKQTAQANLFIGAIAALLIPFPIIEEQNEIVRILDKCFDSDKTVKDAASTALNQLEVIRKSILSKAFRGELMR